MSATQKTQISVHFRASFKSLFLKVYYFMLVHSNKKKENFLIKHQVILINSTLADIY